MAYSACYTSSLIPGSGGGGGGGPVPNIRQVLQAGNDALGLSLGGINLLDVVDVNASGGVTCALVDASGGIACDTLISAGLVTCGAVDSSGLVICSGVDSSGQVSCTSVDSTGAVVCSRVDASGEVACALVNSAGVVTCSGVSASGTVSSGGLNTTNAITSSLVIAGRTYPTVSATPASGSLGSIKVSTFTAVPIGVSGAVATQTFLYAPGFYAGKCELDLLVVPDVPAIALVKIYYGTEASGLNIGYSRTLIAGNNEVFTVCVPFFVNVLSGSTPITVVFSCTYGVAGNWQLTAESDIDMFRIF